VNPAARWHGLVLAGGRSRRMGRDKALLELGGEPLWRRQAGALRAAGAEEVWLALRPGQDPYPGASAWLRDSRAGCGPLAALHAALARRRGGWLLVLPVDMPATGPAWFARLRAHCRPGSGAAYRTPDGFEPLAAIYPPEALGEAAARLGRGERTLQPLVRALAAAGRMTLLPLAAAERGRAANWNDPLPDPAGPAPIPG
jgi:molybdopterin-guanine dinucleotide biosynthesis protein A